MDENAPRRERREIDARRNRSTKGIDNPIVTNPTQPNAHKTNRIEKNVLCRDSRYIGKNAKPDRRGRKDRRARGRAGRAGPRAAWRAPSVFCYVGF